MATRGSLTMLMKSMASLFKQQRYPQLAIIHSKRGKYYTLLTMPELESLPSSTDSEGSRLVLCLTPKELRQIYEHDQITLFNPTPWPPGYKYPKRFQIFNHLSRSIHCGNHPGTTSGSRFHRRYRIWFNTHWSNRNYRLLQRSDLPIIAPYSIIH